LIGLIELIELIELIGLIELMGLIELIELMVNRTQEIESVDRAVSFSIRNPKSKGWMLDSGYRKV